MHQLCSCQTCNLQHLIRLSGAAFDKVSIHCIRAACIDPTFRVVLSVPHLDVPQQEKGLPGFQKTC